MAEGASRSRGSRTASGANRPWRWSSKGGRARDPAPPGDGPPIAGRAPRRTGAGPPARCKRQPAAAGYPGAGLSAADPPSKRALFCRGGGAQGRKAQEEEDHEHRVRAHEVLPHGRDVAMAPVPSDCRDVADLQEDPVRYQVAVLERPAGDRQEHPAENHQDARPEMRVAPVVRGSYPEERVELRARKDECESQEPVIDGGKDVEDSDCE